MDKMISEVFCLKENCRYNLVYQTKEGFLGCKLKVIAINKVGQCVDFEEFKEED